MAKVYGPDTKCNTFWWSWSSSHGGGLRSTHQVQYILVKLIFITWRRFTVQTPSAIHFGEADLHHMAEVYGPHTKCNTFWWSWSSSFGEGLRSRHQCNTFWWSWSSSHGEGLRSRHQVQYILVKLIFIIWRRFTVQTPMQYILVKLIFII